MIIKNALVFTEDCKFAEKDVYIDGERIADTASDSEVIDAKGFYVIPGLIDLSTTACLSSKESVSHAVAWLVICCSLP